MQRLKKLRDLKSNIVKLSEVSKLNLLCLREYSMTKATRIQKIIECKDLPTREDMLMCSVCREGEKVKQVELGRKVRNETITTSFRLCQNCRERLVEVLK
jgi:hypothetical protein